MPLPPSCGELLREHLHRVRLLPPCSDRSLASTARISTLPTSPRTWYEIGRTQTKGGGFFQRNCVCTQLVVGPYAPGGDAAVENACREKTPSGKLQVFNATLSHQSPPGHWLETPPPSGVNYTVIEIGSDYSVEYDCREDSLLGPQYCIHILSRTPTMDVDLQSTLLSRAYAMGLNPENISFAKTVQDGCW